MPERDDKSVLDQFLDQYWKDREAEEVHSIAHYLRRFPGADNAIAAEFTDLQRHGDAPLVPDDGSTIGPYRTISELGRGGQGVVYLAEDMRNQRKVALKVLSNLGPGSDEVVRRFWREAEVASKLEHPGICSVHEAGTESGIPFIAMQFVEGQTLAERISAAQSDATTLDASIIAFDLDDPADPATVIESNGEASDAATRVEVVRVLEVFEKIARALHVAHEAGVVHRDIKPANVIVATDGQPVVLDFGLAWADNVDAETLTRTGDLFGTPAYMSPEQLTRGSIRLDRRTDVYSLGATLYECLTLKRPFEAPTREALYQVIMTRDPVDPRKLNPRIPPELKVVLEAALEKGRDRRYQTAKQFADELKRVRLREPVWAKPIGRVQRVRRWAQRNPAAAVAVSAISVGLVVTSLLWWQSATERRRADDNAAAASVNLARYDRLSDEFKLQELMSQARDDLWPAVPAKAQAMATWLDQARRIAGLLPTLRADLEALRSVALPWSEEDRSRDRASHPDELDELAALASEKAQINKTLTQLQTQSQRAQQRVETLEERMAEIATDRARLGRIVAKRLTYAFDDPRDGWRHDRLSAFVDALVAFTSDDAHGETIAAVEARHAFASTVEQRSLDAHDKAWQEARAAIEASDHYGGLQLAPQLGLVPLGKDPQSGMQEFAHLESGSAPARDAATGKLRLTEDTGIVFVLIPAGTFTMGAQAERADGAGFDPEAHPRESPPHDVTLSAFFISKYEMTQAQWLRVTGSNPSSYTTGFRDAIESLLHPVEQVSGTDCDTVLARLGLILPTEAQWEYACRAGTRTPWSSGKTKETLEGAVNLADQAAATFGVRWPEIDDWPTLDDGFPLHSPVGSYRANGYGLHDMHGNLWEWVRDWWLDYDIPTRSGDGLRVGDERVPNRVWRGGSFNVDARTARSSMRDAGMPGFRTDIVGLRPARSVTR